MTTTPGILDSDGRTFVVMVVCLLHAFGDFRSGCDWNWSVLLAGWGVADQRTEAAVSCRELGRGRIKWGINRLQITASTNQS